MVNGTTSAITTTIHTASTSIGTLSRIRVLGATDQKKLIRASISHLPVD